VRIEKGYEKDGESMVKHFHEASEGVERAKLLIRRTRDTRRTRLGLPSPHASVVVDPKNLPLRPSRLLPLP
jgi:hypothetical protein